MKNKSKIAFYCSNSHLPEIDFSTPELGNPGCGAAEYLHVAIPYYLHKYFAEFFEVTIIADHVCNLPDAFSSIQVNGIVEAVNYAASNSIDIFVFRPRVHEEEDILDLIDSLKLPSIGRAALTPSWDHLIKMNSSKYFKCLVCVGKSQYIDLMDSPLSSKIFHINNGISDEILFPNYIDSIDLSTLDRNDIVYMGSLVPQKNFHYLASVWYKISKRKPTANLHVIGSAGTYGFKHELGPRGLAHKNYEKLIFDLLLRDPTSFNKVFFHGNLGREKYLLLLKSRLGIVNPLGTTETCCVSAVEMQALGLPVLTGNYQSLRTTVVNKKTGLLSSSKNEFVNNICDLYDSSVKLESLSRNAILHASTNYAFSSIIVKWKNLFLNLAQSGSTGADLDEYSIMIPNTIGVSVRRFNKTSIQPFLSFFGLNAPSLTHVRLIFKVKVRQVLTIILKFVSKK